MNTRTEDLLFLSDLLALLRVRAPPPHLKRPAAVPPRAVLCVLKWFLLLECVPEWEAQCSLILVMINDSHPRLERLNSLSAISLFRYFCLFLLLAVPEWIESLVLLSISRHRSGCWKQRIN